MVTRDIRCLQSAIAAGEDAGYALRDAIAEAGIDRVTNSIGMAFIPIVMGGDQAVFYMGAYQVTQEQYEKVMGKNPSWFQ